jgi:acetyl esterase/lipase
MLIGWGAVAWIGAPAGLAQGTSRTIDARDIPIPAAASQALRDSIAAMPMMPIADSAPSTAAEWEAFVQQSDGAANGTLEPLAAAFNVQVDQFEVDGVPIYRVLPANVDPRHAEHRFLYVHGGAYVLGGGEAGVMEAVLIASRANIQVIAIDYRMPPAHPFPAAVDDAVAVYRHVLGNRPASSIALGGTSAGGGLTLATVHKLIELGVEVPGAIYLGTPWADLTDTSDTLHTNESIDRVLVTYDGWIGGAARLYAGNHELTHRLISPLYGDFDGFPPAYLVSGTRDMLLSDTVRVHRKLREAGVVADLNVYEGMSHADYMIVANSPESEQVYAELGAFLVDHLK